MRRNFGLLIITLAVLLVTAAPAWADSYNSAESIIFPLDAYLSNDCTGEGVHVIGTLHWLIRESVDPNGRWHYLLHENYQNMTAIGMDSGIEYQVSSADNSNLNWDFSFTGGQEAYTSVSTLQLIVPGQDGNLLLKMFLHATVDANDVLVVDLDSVDLVCP